MSNIPGTIQPHFHDDKKHSVNVKGKTLFLYWCCGQRKSLIFNVLKCSICGKTQRDKKYPFCTMCNGKDEYNYNISDELFPICILSGVIFLIIFAIYALCKS